MGQAEDPCTRPVPGNPGNECAAYGRGHGVAEPDDVVGRFIGMGREHWPRDG